MTCALAAPPSAPDAALAYWRACCAIAAAHAFGRGWPPSEAPPVREPRGHWGANPGIAWIAAHLAAGWDRSEPLQLVVGTGHATSFVLAHEALREGWPAQRINHLIEKYGSPGGCPSELLEQPARPPHLFGELGAAVGVAQGLASASGRPTVCIIGDGECETPATLAALAHGAVLANRGDMPLIVAVNANGARMGGPARFGADALARLFMAMDYEVARSNENPTEAGAAALKALTAAAEARPVIWISCTPKGWPASDPFAARPFRGSAAHKVPAEGCNDGMLRSAAAELVTELAAYAFLPDGQPRRDARTLAARLSLAAPASKDVVVQPYRGWFKGSAPRPPIVAVDQALAEKGVTLFSPDEAASNRLHRCLEAGLVTEVLAEEVCLAWTIGYAAAGREAVFATYEAFAPLAASQLAQYAKLVAVQDLAPRPPVAVLLTSLGWGNAPTHRNSDLAAVFLNRGSPRFRLICPLGAASAAWRLRSAFEETRGGAFAMVCSKQALPDLPDPGGPVVRFRHGGSFASAEAIIVTCGDICVAEAVAAMTLAAECGRVIEVVAVVEPTALTNLESGALAAPGVPLLGAVWCAEPMISGPLWRTAGRIFPIRHSEGAGGATPWEHLVSAGLDRHSLLRAALPDFDPGPSPEPSRAEVTPPFVCPPLLAENPFT